MESESDYSNDDEVVPFGKSAESIEENDSTECDNNSKIVPQKGWKIVGCEFNWYPCDIKVTAFILQIIQCQPVPEIHLNMQTKNRKFL